jgi:hypothetical protein
MSVRASYLTEANQAKIHGEVGHFLEDREIDSIDRMLSS